MLTKRCPSLPCHLRQRWAVGRQEKQTGAAAGELVNKSALDAKTQRSRVQSRWEAGAEWVGWAGVGGGAAGAGARWGRSLERVPPVPPGLTHALRRAHPPDLPRPEGAGGGRGRGCSGSRKGIGGRRKRPACHPPPAESGTGSPRLAPPTAPAAGRLPLQPAARPALPRPGPGGQVPRSPGPQEPPGRGRSVPPAPSSDVSVSRRRGKEGGGGSSGTCPSCGGGRPPE